MGRLQGRVAFITGAGAGIAKVASQLFAREGAKIAVIELNPETGATTAKLVNEQGGEALFLQTDITNEEQVKKAVGAAVAKFGKIDLLFNCAGGSTLDDGLVTEGDLLTVWNKSMTLNLLGTMMCCRHVIPEIIKSGGGTVVNMSSGAALRGGSPLQVYTASKGGIVSLTRSLAGAYVKNNIRVNTICAGRIATERNVVKYGKDGKGGGTIVDRQDAAGRSKEYPFWMGEPIDIANIALFLSTEDSRMITGAAIPADGGRSAY